MKIVYVPTEHGCMGIMVPDDEDWDDMRTRAREHYESLTLEQKLEAVIRYISSKYGEA